MSYSVVKTGIADRACRWQLFIDGEAVGFFPSKRAAKCFAETGVKFKTNPHFPVIGGRRGTKRDR